MQVAHSYASIQALCPRVTHLVVTSQHWGERQPQDQDVTIVPHH